MVFKKNNIPWNKGLDKEKDGRVKKYSISLLGNTNGRGNKGRKFSEKTKEKISKAHKGKHHSPKTEFKKGLIPWCKGKKNCFSKEALEKIIKNHADFSGENHPFFGKKHSLKVKEKMSISAKKNWNKKIYRERMLKLLFSSWAILPNKPEKKLISIIKRHNLPYKYVGNGALTINGFCPDFINCNGEKKIIEFFGEYWHNTRGNIKYHQTEKGRKAIFAEYGFKTLIIWESELNTLSEKEILRKISEW